MNKLQKILSKTSQTWIEVSILTIFLSLKLLFKENMDINEVDVLPLAKQYADPSWIPGDWYLNQPPGYRLLFDLLFGRLILVLGFIDTSILGRLICYVLVALGLVLISRKLFLSLPWLLIAVGLFLYINKSQGVAAAETLVGPLEPKSIAYGLVLLAIAQMLNGRFYSLALMLGLATSLHVLVGGWALITVLGWLALRWKTRFGSIKHFGLFLGIYLLASVFAFKPTLEQLFSTPSNSSVAPSYIYVFQRLPHHLDPLSWRSLWWIEPTIYLLVLALSVWLLWRQQQSDRQSWQYIARMELAQFTFISLIPFIFGLIVAPFDRQGKLLQYYPFRLGDMMLPLNTCLLFVCVLEQTFRGQTRRLLLTICMILLSVKCSIQAVTFEKQILTLGQFPNVNPEFKALCSWVRIHTPANTTVVSPPVDFVEFTWMAERPTIANFKLLPQTKASILLWYERLSDLSGLPVATLAQKNKQEFKRMLANGYDRLTTDRANDLMTKYQATYFMTNAEHQLDFPTAYHNSHYVLYAKNTSS
jgi:hypothetical protein